MRVVFDVNILVRLTLGSSLVAKLIRAANDAVFVILVNDLLMDERALTIRKPRLADQIDLSVYGELLAFLKDEAEIVAIQRPFPICRDSSDDYLLAIARDGRADYLVTNDQDLLPQERLESCQILTPEAFSQRFETKSAG